VCPGKYNYVGKTYASDTYRLTIRNNCYAGIFIFSSCYTFSKSPSRACNKYGDGRFALTIRAPTYPSTSFRNVSPGLSSYSGGQTNIFHTAVNRAGPSIRVTRVIGFFRTKIGIPLGFFAVINSFPANRIRYNTAVCIRNRKLPPALCFPSAE